MARKERNSKQNVIRGTTDRSAKFEWLINSNPTQTSIVFLLLKTDITGTFHLGNEGNKITWKTYRDVLRVYIVAAKTLLNDFEPPWAGLSLWPSTIQNSYTTLKSCQENFSARTEASQEKG